MFLRKVNKVLLIGSAALFLVAGCDQGTRDKMFPSVSQQANQISYYKDERTQLCFVHSTVYTDINSTVFSHVPCTPEVEGLIRGETAPPTQIRKGGDGSGTGPRTGHGRER